MKLRAMQLLGLLAFAGAFVALFAFSGHHREQSFTTALVSATTWQHMTTPGDLSRPHAFLENNCAACHTAMKGVDAENCIVCHADNKSLLQRQPTAFHAQISECAACHLEHQGRVPNATKMDHAALAHIGCQMLESAPSPARTDMAAVKRWLSATSATARPANHRAAEEALLSCASCHQTKDRHAGLFGSDCASCHATAQWTIAEFRHPSAASQSCAQCHQAPPSHYMMHFDTISKKIAGQEDAQVAECCGPTQVNQCYRCHQTTSWNDIKGVGFYKHH